MSISFHARREIREEFDFVSQRILVEMRQWFDDWSRSKRVMQCFSLFVKWLVMKIKSMMLIELRILHVMMFFDKIRVRLRFLLYREDCLLRHVALSETNHFKKSDEDWNLLKLCDDLSTRRLWSKSNSTTWTNCFWTNTRSKKDCKHYECESRSYHFLFLWQSFSTQWCQLWNTRRLNFRCQFDH
jgi:hypothetical protein